MERDEVLTVRKRFEMFRGGKKIWCSHCFTFVSFNVYAMALQFSKEMERFSRSCFGEWFFGKCKVFVLSKLSGGRFTHKFL